MDMKLSDALPAPSRQDLLMPLVNELVEYTKAVTKGDIDRSDDREFLLRYLIKHLDLAEIRSLAVEYRETFGPSGR